MPADLDQLQNRLGYKFRCPNLLSLALTHPSCHIQGLKTNRRLEFFGDHVLGVIIAEALYKKYPDFDEGVLTKLLSRIVNNSSLAEHARAIGLGEHLTIKPEVPELRTLETSLSNAFEALVGAIKLDGGLEPTRDFVLREFAADLNETTIDSHNPKGDLMELLQSRSQPAPTYMEILSSGPEHNKSFTCAVMCDGVERGRGGGKSKKEAEANAALDALDKLHADSSAP